MRLIPYHDQSCAGAEAPHAGQSGAGDTKPLCAAQACGSNTNHVALVGLILCCASEVTLNASNACRRDVQWPAAPTNAVAYQGSVGIFQQQSPCRLALG